MFLPSILCIMNDSNITSQSPYRVVLLNEEDYEEVIMGRSLPSDIFLPSESVVGVRTSTSDDDKYCWQECCETEMCKECARLNNGRMDYFDNTFIDQ